MDKEELQRVLQEIGRGAQTQLGDYLGLRAPVMSRLVNGDRTISADEAVRIRLWLKQFGKEVGDGPGAGARGPLEQAAPERSTGSVHHVGSRAEIEDLPPANATIATQAPRLLQRTEMARDVPVMGTVMGGDTKDEVDFQLNGQVVDYVRRPPRIAGRKDVFAAYVQGTSMSPWREPGKLIYVEQARPPAIGDYVLVELKPARGDEVRGALVKQFKGATQTKYKLYQYNPSKDLLIDRHKVLNIFRVMDLDELLGV